MARNGGIDTSRSRIRFGEFELDQEERELWRDGRKVPLQQQPLQILELLVTRAGQVVTREEIRQAVWPDDDYGQFDAGVGNAIRKIRVALRDDADNARFLKTLPRQGFRFIAPVTQVGLLLPTEAIVSMPVAVRTESKARNVKAWASAAVGVASVALIFAWAGTREHPPNLDGTRPLAASGGKPSHPSFSPRGDMLAFDWNGPDDADQAIYLQRLEDTSPVRLTPGKQMELWPVWSPDGKRIAFLRETAPDRMEAVVISVVGIGERSRFELGKTAGERPRLDWSPDGRWLATVDRKKTPDSETEKPASTILLYSLETGEKRTLTHPPVDWRGDSEPVFSPDSKEVAFRRTQAASGHEDIFRLPLSGGKPVAVTGDDVGVSGLVYTPDGGILFSSRRGGWLRNLWWVGRGGGTPKLVSNPAFDLGAPAVSRDGRHVAYTKVLNDINLWRVPVAGGEPEAVSPSEFVEQNPSFSPDGSKILFVSSRTGSLEVWSAAASGAGAVQLTSGQNFAVVPQWSPDGKYIAYQWLPKGREGIYIMPSSGGAPRAVVLGSARDTVPRWSRDAQFLYFNSNRSGRQEIWRVPAQGGAPVQITANGGCAAAQSGDGSALYYAKPGIKGVWVSPLRNGLPSGPESRVMQDLDVADCGNWALGRAGIYYVRRGGINQKHGTICLFHLDTGVTTIIHEMKAPPLWQGFGLAVSPAEDTILFGQVDRDGASIYGR